MSTSGDEYGIICPGCGLRISHQPWCNQWKLLTAQQQARDRGDASEPSYRWSSIEFSARLPWVWLHPVERTEGAADGICLKFDSLTQFRELVMTLQGALNAAERERFR